MSKALVGHTLAGRFRLTGVLGEGAMATVYRGEQDAEPRDLAVKVMHAELAIDPTFARRFRREARAAALLKHRSTVQIIDYGVDDKVAYIAMELLVGRDLFDTLSRERRLSEARAAKILIEVCDVLVTAHDMQIVHRDLKPENIMLLPNKDGTERVKVLDFGIAKLLDKEPREADSSAGGNAPESGSAVSSALTTVGVIVGTPEYMSPEQCRGEGVDKRSDIYSCGILLYQLITGRLPFTGDSIVDIALQHIRTPPPKPSDFVPFVNAGLEAIILTALEKWPAQRQQSAAELKAALEKLVPQLRTVPFRLGGTAREEAPVAAPGRRPLAEIPADSVRFVKTMGTPQTPATETMRSRETPVPPLPGRVGDMIPSTDRDGVVIHLANESGPVMTSTPTMPAAPPVNLDTLASGDRAPVQIEVKVPAKAASGSLKAERSGERTDTRPSYPSPEPVLVEVKKPTRSSSKKRKETSFWILVPIAVLVGISVGAVVFFLTQ